MHNPKATDCCGGPPHIYQLRAMATKAEQLAESSCDEKLIDPYYPAKKGFTLDQQITAVNTVMTMFRCGCVKDGYTSDYNQTPLVEQLVCPFVVMFTFFFVLFTFLIYMWTEYCYYNMTAEFGNGLCVSRTYYTQRNCVIIY